MNVYEEVTKGTFLEAARTGSRYICNPPVLDTDDDYIVLVDNLEQSLEKFLYKEGWKRSGSEGYSTDGEWESIKKTIDGTVVNLIMTDNENYFNRFVHATETAKKLNLLEKADRIVLFKAIVSDMPNHEEVELSEVLYEAQEVSFTTSTGIMDEWVTTTAPPLNVYRTALEARASLRDAQRAYVYESTGRDMAINVPQTPADVYRDFLSSYAQDIAIGAASGRATGTITEDERGF
jgi:hypothetical protein